MDDATRLQRAKAAGYRFMLKFTREFRYGSLLAGVRHDDMLPLCQMADGRAWVNAVNAKASKNKLDYKVIRYQVVALSKKALPVLVWKGGEFQEEVAIRGWDPVKEKSFVQLTRMVAHWTSQTVEHGLTDNKGRTLGNYASIDAYQPFATGPDGRSLAELVPEVAYFVSTGSTRNGNAFGACWSRPTECKSLEEAKALAAKKIAAAGRRFAKLVAEGKGRQFRKVQP